MMMNKKIPTRTEALANNKQENQNTTQKNKQKKTHPVKHLQFMYLLLEAQLFTMD